MQAEITNRLPKSKGLSTAWKKIRRHWELYVVMLPALIYLIIFKYVPMYGVVLAFKNFNLSQGILGSPWCGFQHFREFFSSYEFSRLLINTLGISIYNLVASFFPPIILAIALNYVTSKAVGKTVQMVTYMPHFISTAILVSILYQVLSLNGIVNQTIKSLGGHAIYFMGNAAMFKSIYVWSDVWQTTGYSAIIYLAALSSVNPELYEAAMMDGASIWQRIIHIDIPGIVPTAVILLILGCGKIVDVGYEKVYLMQNQLNTSTSEVISTYVYKIGLVSMQYSYSTAINLFQSVISLIMVTLVNWVSRRVSDTSLW